MDVSSRACALSGCVNLFCSAKPLSTVFCKAASTYATGLCGSDTTARSIVRSPARKAGSAGAESRCALAAAGALVGAACRDCVGGG